MKINEIIHVKSLLSTVPDSLTKFKEAREWGRSCGEACIGQIKADSKLKSAWKLYYVVLKVSCAIFSTLTLIFIITSV